MMNNNKPSSLLTAASIMSLISQSAYAIDAKKGFEPGKPFNNPFADGAVKKPGTPPPPGAAPAAGNEFFGDDADSFDVGDDEEGGVPAPSQGAFPRGGRPSMGGGGFNPAFGGSGGAGGMSMGGSNPVNSAKNIPSIKIDSDSGDGSKEVVTEFNFPDADILDIAKTLGKLTGKNFILDKDVKGRVTIISNSPISVGDAWRAFLTALDMNGFSLVPSGKYLRIARQRDARDKQAKIYTGDYSPDSDALITRIFALKYISSEEVARTFRSIMPPNARIIPYDQTNTLIVTDTGSNIFKLSKLIELLDVEGFDAGIEVIPVKFASASEIAKLIDTLLPGTGAGARTGAAPRPGFGASGSRFSARRTKEGGIINNVISDERTNALIVHANGKGVDQVKSLVAKLDKTMPAQSGGGKVHVIYLQFAESEAVANTLNALSSGAVTRPSTGGGSGTGTGTNPQQQAIFEGSIKVSPDKATNSLVVTASPSDFATLQRVIAKLDIPRDEVYVEAVIMEMTLSKDFQFSTNVVLPTSGIALSPNADLASALANPIAQKGMILGFKGGNTSTLNINGTQTKVSSVQGLIKALQVSNQANILATPQILTLDNQEATFESAEKIPVPKTVTNQGVVTSSVEKESVALSIKIKPQINKISNYVKLDIETKLADIVNRELPAEVAGKALATVERSTKTSVVVADADTVVLGGLVRDSRDETVSKIPILGDIPLLGWLFKAKSSSSRKTNLLVFITPQIVRQYEKIRAILDKKLKERDGFIEQAAGGMDPSREYRDDMIRNLPDLKNVTGKMPKAESGSISASSSLGTGGGVPAGSSVGAPPSEAAVPMSDAPPSDMPSGDSAAPAIDTAPLEVNE